jgi:invasion protein IalB
MPFFSTRLWAAILAGSLCLPGAVFAQAKKPAAPPAHPAAPAPAPAPAPAAPAEGSPQAGQQPQGSSKVDLVAVQLTWSKVCGKDEGGKDLCFTTRDFGIKQDQPVLSLQVFDTKVEDRLIRLALPMGMALKPGFRVTVDKGPSVDGSYDICYQNACFGQIKIKAAYVDAMKKASTLIVSTKNAKGDELDFNVPLTGFSEAYDGPAIDPKVLEEQQKKMQEELQKRADEERKRLEAVPAGGAAGGATLPPANPAPAAPAPK